MKSPAGPYRVRTEAAGRPSPEKNSIKLWSQKESAENGVFKPFSALYRAGSGNRTRLSSLGSWHTTDVLYLQVRKELYTVFPSFARRKIMRGTVKRPLTPLQPLLSRRFQSARMLKREPGNGSRTPQNTSPVKYGSETVFRIRFGYPKGLNGRRMPYKRGSLPRWT